MKGHGSGLLLCQGARPLLPTSAPPSGFKIGASLGCPKKFQPDAKQKRNGMGFVEFETLTLNKEFRRLYGRGKSFVSPALVTYILPNKSGVPRIGITTGKKIGCAVKRNRAKRVITAAWRNCLPELKSSADIVFVARFKTPLLKSGDIERAMRKHLTEFGLL